MLRGDCVAVVVFSCSLDDSGVEVCDARVISELQETETKAKLPDRFMMAVRAIRGAPEPCPLLRHTEPTAM